MDIYEDLLKSADSVRNMKVEANGIDDFLSGNKIRVASLGDLSEFFRVSSDTLVHKAVKDLWKISEDKKGNVIIERLFDPETKKPLKV